MKRKLERNKKGSRQYGRRLRTEPFKLSVPQKLLLATSYRAARNDCRLRLKVRKYSLRNFQGQHASSVFAGESMLREMQEALIEQRILKTDQRTKIQELNFGTRKYEWSLSTEVNRALKEHRAEVHALGAHLEKHLGFQENVWRFQVLSSQLRAQQLQARDSLSGERHRPVQLREEAIQTALEMIRF
ncbi:hypothetical protein GQ600_6983 [Phytophthora cactorum]|nr:hypothetical protein GQ600_6983 [Phytophthora cactorum]